VIAAQVQPNENYTVRGGDSGTMSLGAAPAIDTVADMATSAVRVDWKKQRTQPRAADLAVPDMVLAVDETDRTDAASGLARTN
jgi:hypothetical protein